MLTRRLRTRITAFCRRLSPSRFRCQKPTRTETPGTPLRVLTLAAMALPGMAMAVQPEDAQIQYSKYQEGGRDVWRGPGPDAPGRIPSKWTSCTSAPAPGSPIG